MVVMKFTDEDHARFSQRLRDCLCVLRGVLDRPGFGLGPQTIGAEPDEVDRTTVGVTVYDDFAHHPTAIRTTLQGLRNRFAGDEIVAVIEPRSHTMSLGTLRDELSTCCAAAAVR